MARDIFREALIDELSETLPRDVARQLIAEGLFQVIVSRQDRRRFRCGAKTVSIGKPCQARALPSGRCKWHGGKSTGPKTAKGKARIAAAQRRRWAAYRKSKEG